MAILKGGVNGPFSGKVGSIVGYELNGQAIIRGLPVRPKRKPTKLAALNQQRMKAVSQFLRPIKRMIDWGYRDLAPPGSRVGAFQQAQSYTFKNSLDYDKENDNAPYVNPEKVLLFRGDLEAPRHPQVKREGNKLIFEWDRVPTGRYNSMLVAVIYDGDHKYDQMLIGPDLSAGTCVWEPEKHVMEVDSALHVYVGAKSTFSNKLSDSVYVGVV